MLSLTPEGFSRRFKGSPVKRARRRGALRNAAVALGNLPDPAAMPAAMPAAIPAALPALIRVLHQEPEPLVRAHAAWALGRLGGEAAAQALGEALQAEADETVRLEIAQALEALR
jgi:epoxyqueuosine reductase